MRVTFLLLILCLCYGEEYEGYTGYWMNVVATGYSPHDGIDHHYHETKGERWRWITADGRTDVRQVPYGVAVPLNAKGKPWIKLGTKIIIPSGQGYLDKSRPDDRVFPIDDVGNGKEYFKKKGGRLHIDLRFMQTSTALKWGEKKIKVFVITGVAPVPVVEEPVIATAAVSVPAAPVVTSMIPNQASRPRPQAPGAWQGRSAPDNGSEDDHEVLSWAAMGMVIVSIAALVVRITLFPPTRKVPKDYARSNRIAFLHGVTSLVTWKGRRFFGRAAP